MRSYSLLRPFCLIFGLILPATALAQDSGRQDRGQAEITAQRIVSIGGDVTEIVFALGAGDRVIAIDDTATWPPEATELPSVGYMRALGAEGVLSVNPDLILLSEGSGPPEVVQQLEASGVPVVRVPYEQSLDGVRAKVGAVAGALGLEAEGQALIADFDAELAEIQAAVEALPETPRALFLLTTDTPMLAAGDQTSADSIIRLAGGENVMSQQSGYRPLSTESVVVAAPDHLILMAHVFDGLEALRSNPILALTPAVTSGRVHAIDGTLLLGFGPRTPLAIRLLAEALHGVSLQ